MKNTNHDTRSSRTSAKSCNQQPSAPTSGGSVEYNELFGTPALNSDNSGPDKGTDQGGKTDSGPVQHSDLFGTPAIGPEPDRDPFASNRDEPPAAPSLPFTAQPAERAVYEEAFRAAYRYPDALMLVMSGIRQGLKRGKEVAEGRGAHRE